MICGQRREQAERARCARPADRATVCPSGVFGISGEAVVAAARVPYSLQHRQTGLMRGVGVAATAAQPPLILGVIASLRSPTRDIGIMREG